MKAWKKYLIAFSIIVILFLTFWPQLLHTEIIKTAREEMEEHLEAKVIFSDLTISIWKNFPGLTLSLSDLSAVQSQHTADTLLLCEQLSLVVNVFDYVRHGVIDVKKIELENPVLDARIYADGTSNLSIIKHEANHSHDSLAANIQLHLEHFLLHNATISFNDYASNVHMKLEQLEGEAMGDFSRKFFELTTDLTCQKSFLEIDEDTWFDNKAIGVQISSHIDHEKNTYKILKSNVVINHLAFQLDGALEVLSDRYGVDMKFASANSTLAELFSLSDFFRQKIKNIETNGKMDLGGFVKGYYIPGTDSIPTFEAKIAIKDGSFKMDTLEETMEGIHFNLLVSNNRGIIDSTNIVLDSIFFYIQDRSVQGHAEIQHLTNSKIDALFSGSIKAEELLEIYPIEGMKARGLLDFKIEVDGRYSKLKGRSILPHIVFDVELSSGKLKYDSQPDSLSNVSFHLTGTCPQGRWEHSSISLSHLKMNIADSPVEGRFAINDFSKPRIDAYLNASLELEDILNSYPIEGTAMRGTLNTQVTINGLYNPTQKQYPKINAAISVVDGFLATVNYPKPLKNVQLKAELKNASSRLETAALKIEKFTYDLDDDELFEVRGTIIDFTKYFYDLSIKGTTDLEKLSAIYPMIEGTLKGKVFSDFSISGSLADLELNRYDRTKARGTLQLKDVSIESNSLARTVQIPTASFHLTPEVLKLDTLHLITGRSSLWASGQLYDYLSFFTKDNDKIMARLKVQSDTVDLNEWKSLFTSSKDNALPVTTKPQSTTAWKVPATLDFDLDSDLKNVFYQDMILQDMKGQILIKEGVMSINKSKFNSLNAKFNASGKYDSRNEDHPLFDFKLLIEDLDIQRAYKEIALVRELLPVTADAEGLFSVDYSLQGELNHDMYPKTETLIGNGTMYIAEAKINGMKMFEQLSKAAKKDEMKDPHLKDFSMESEIKNNKVYVKPFKLKVSGFNTEIEGITDIAGAVNYVVKVQLLPLNMLKLPFHVTGTYNNPKVILGKGHELPKM
jgi:AsmA protein